MKFQQFMDESLLMTLFQQFHQTFAPLQSDLRKQGLNLNEALILLAVFFENNRPPRPTDLQKCLLLPKDQISQTLKKLENKNYLERKIADGDKRQRQITLTPLGRQLTSHLIKLFDTREDQLEAAAQN